MTKWPKVAYVGVGCIVMRDGHLLLVRRQGEHGAASWSTPGGHLDFGETPEDCAARETLEETGISVSNVEFVAMTNDFFPEDERHYVTVWMTATADAGAAAIHDPSEIAEVEWFAPLELPEPLFLSFKNLVAGRCYPSPPMALSWLQVNRTEDAR